MNVPKPSLLPKSISVLLLDATVKPGALKDWITEVEQEVVAGGKFTKTKVGYLPVHPPPALYDYRCSKCYWWADGQCKVVAGEISPNGWCFIWVPART